VITASTPRENTSVSRVAVSITVWTSSSSPPGGRTSDAVVVPTCGCREPGHLCDLHVLVDEAAESIPSEHADARSGTRRGVACGRALVQRSVRAVGVEVLDILAQDDVEVAWSGDQDVIEAFPAQRADEPFPDRVRPGRLGRSTDDPDVGTGEDGVECRGEFAVSVADQKPEPVGAVAEVHEKVAGLLGDPGAGGVGGDPGEVHAAAAVFDDEEDVEAAQEDGVDVGEVDGEDGVGLGGQELSPGRPSSSGRGIESCFLQDLPDR